MDAAEKVNRAHPRASANPIAALIFWWTLKVFRTGYGRDLEQTDLYEPLSEHTSITLGDKLEKEWKFELQKGNNKPPSLVKALWRIFGVRYMLFGIIVFFMECIVKVAQPIFLGRFLRYFSTDMPMNEGMLWAGGVVLCQGLTVFLQHPFSMGVMHIGMQIRVSVCSLVYRKALKLSHTALGQTTSGQAVNLLSNDVNRFDTAMVLLHYIWVGLVQIPLVAYLMWMQMQESAMMGLAFIVLLIPLQAFITRSISKLRMKTAMKTDERVRLMNEIISGIQVIKMYAWEKPFEKLIALVRRKEIQHIRHMSYIRGILFSIVMFATRITLFISLVSYTLLGNTITADKVFVLQTYYNILRNTMTMFFPQAIAQVAELRVSITRIQNFLMLDERSDEITHESRDLKQEGHVEVKDACAQWSTNTSEPTLSNVDLKLVTGQLVAAIGPVGSGKSSLIQVILRELPLKSGSVSVSGRLSYAAQEPWLFSASIRQNILFGEPWDALRYSQVVRVCALERDLNQLPYGDRTIVGERGVTLSGGQRARVNLARAVYKDADVYLLDDPLSAVDAHVGRHLFDECIKNFLRHKAVFLVTHQLQYLTEASHIVILNNGRIEEQGTYSQLQSSGLDFARLLEETEDEVEEEEEGEEKKDRKTSLEGVFRRITSLRKTKEPGGEEKMPRIVAEMKAQGEVSGEVYSRYFLAGGNWVTVFFTFAMLLVTQTVGSGVDYWVSYWTNWEAEHLISDESRITFFSKWLSKASAEWLTTDICIYIYSGLLATVIFLSLVRAFVFYGMCMRSSIVLHNDMFSGISRATMAFFNNNPSGRILNRFSKDMGGVDELLPSTMIDTLQILLSLVGTFVIVAIANYWLLIPTAIITVIFYFMRLIYLRTSRSVKRMEGITRSPVFTHLNSSVQGLSTIRACRAQKILETQFDGHQDVHSSAFYLFISLSRSFNFWMDIICFLYVAVVVFSFFAVKAYGAGVGLAVTQVLGITGMFQYGMRQSAELENQMTSVERVLEFSNLESEPALEKSSDADKEWPSKGEIRFEKVKMRYNKNDPDVLKEVSFTIPGSSKIGVVGRTGAGKSSLISALFRLSDVHSGQIVIDGVETSTVGLHQLRASISIIPQEPVLFSGTMRNNLDPFDQYPDNQLWDALAEVELKEAVSELNGGLGAHMSEGGSNFSVGQRQLVCLARAIIRNNRILMLDEATANVDLKTDSLIQHTIRRKFANCTVLTIAHRLNTVMDSDKVLVMDAGKVAEFAPPQELLADHNSSFYGLAEQTGAIAALNRGANNSKL